MSNKNEVPPPPPKKKKKVAEVTEEGGQEGAAGKDGGGEAAAQHGASSPTSPRQPTRGPCQERPAKRTQPGALLSGKASQQLEPAGRFARGEAG